MNLLPDTKEINNDETKFLNHKDITSFNHVTIDYCLYATDSNRCEAFNEYFRKHVGCKVIGVRGYWFANMPTTFNVTDVLTVPSKEYDDFTSIQLIMPGSEYIASFMIAHDLLDSPISKAKLHFFNQNRDIYEIDRNKFITSRLNKYVSIQEDYARDALTKKLSEIYNVCLTDVGYKTYILINTEKPDLKQLNDFMELRNMEISVGYGVWIDPANFVITQLAFREGEKRKVTKLEKSFHQKSYNKEPNTVTIESLKESTVNYSIHLKLTLSVAE